MRRVISDARYFVVPVLVWLADYFLKVGIKYLVPDGTVLSGFLKIGDFHNPRGFFGAVNLPMIILLSIVVIGLLGFLFWKSNDKYEKISLALIFGGGLLNFGERLRFGFVTDYFAVSNLGYFNFADMAIAAGIFLIVFELIKKRKGRTSKERSDLHWRT